MSGSYFGVPERWDAGLWDQAHWDGQIGVTATAGAIALAPKTVRLSIGRRLTATTGAITLTGNNARLSLSPILVATTGALALAPKTVNLRITRNIILSAAKGTIALAGKTANLRITTSLASGSIVITGNIATLRLGHTLTAATGTITLAGTSVVFRTGRSLPASVGTIVLTGNAANLVVAQHQHLTLTAGRGVIAIRGIPVALHVTPGMPAPGPLTFGRKVPLVIPW